MIFKIKKSKELPGLCFFYQEHISLHMGCQDHRIWGRPVWDTKRKRGAASIGLDSDLFCILRIACLLLQVTQSENNPELYKSSFSFNLEPKLHFQT